MGELKKKQSNIKVMVIPTVIGLVSGLEDLEIRNYSIIEFGQNTLKNSGELRKLAVTQTTVRKHRLMLVWKTRKGVNNNNNKNKKKKNRKKKKQQYNNQMQQAET